MFSSVSSKPSHWPKVGDPARGRHGCRVGRRCYRALMATTKKPKVTGKSASRATGRSVVNGIGPIRSKARREKIEALIERTTKPKGLSPAVEAALKDDAWGKRPDS
jgi:hypothetical protein